MNYHNITFDDMKNGDGLRVVLWLSGCEHHCTGCHNPLTWNPDDGLVFGYKEKDEIFKALEKEHISGITFSGGDPFHVKNRYGVHILIQEIKEKYPDKTIWLYTGYTWDFIIQYLVSNLPQGETQTLVDHLYQVVLTICGMPNRNGGSSTSDTGSAVIMRDGWSAAEARAKDSELMFKKSERKFLKIVLNICKVIAGMDLKVCNVEIRFTRRNYENILQKAQVLDTMLNNDKIHPRLAFEHCGLFVDSDLAYTLSAEYAKEQEEKAQELFEKQREGENNVPDADKGNGETD